MKKMFKLFAVLLSFMLLIATIAPTEEEIQAATQKKAGTYSVDGYLIKSISKSGNKLKIVTKNSCDMSVLKDENFNYLSRKKSKTKKIIIKVKGKSKRSDVINYIIPKKRNKRMISLKEK